MAIIQSMLTQLSKQLNLLEKNIEQSQLKANLNTSNCLVCESKNLKVIATKRKKKGYSYRVCICSDCGSTNKQVIETVSVKENDKIFTIKHDKIKKMAQSFTFSVINNELDMNMNENGNKTTIHKIYDKLLPSLKNYTLKMFQKDYDKGLFKIAENNIDPVEIRFVHKKDLNDKINKLFLQYLGIDIKKIKSAKIISVYKVLYKQKSNIEGIFNMNIKNLTVITEKK